MTNVSVLSYGVGNLRSVVRALTHVGGSVTCISEPEEIARSDRLVLPGVGAFRHCADTLRQKGLWDPVAEYLAQNNPFLGICVGMQLMLDTSEEFGTHQGFGTIPGRVVRLPEEAGQKVPMVGWKTTEPMRDTSLLEDAERPSYYFVHSYSAREVADDHTLATYRYGSSRVVAAVQRGNRFGVQFHPEKSGDDGLQLLQRFLKL